MTTPTILDEITDGADAYPFLASAGEALSNAIPVVELSADAATLAARLSGHLDRGEAEALAVAEHRQGLLVTDDGAARSLARERNVRFTGTIGVLVELVENDHLSEATADAWLKELVDDADYRAPSREFSDFL